MIEPVLTVAAWFDCSDPFVLDDIPIQQQIEVGKHSLLFDYLKLFFLQSQYHLAARNFVSELLKFVVIMYHIIFGVHTDLL